MFTIGAFSKLAKTNIRTLRFYDEIDLFKPSRVEDNGYRYYSMEDFNKLARILELRELGLSVNEIKQVIGGKDLKTALQDRLKVIENEIKHSKENFEQCIFLCHTKPLIFRLIMKSSRKGYNTTNNSI